MFERFTERARQVVVLAQEEARTLGHNYIGTEHILLGLLREGEGVAARVLESLGITVGGVRAGVVEIVGPGDEVITTGQIPFTPRAKKVLELALREALSLNHNYIGTEHILLGLVRENEGVAARVLFDFGADSEKIRNEVIRMLSGPGAGEWSEPRTVSSRGLIAGASRLIEPVAGEIQKQFDRPADAGDLLVALASLPDGIVTRTLAGLGINLEALSLAVDEARRAGAHPGPLPPTALRAEIETVREEIHATAAARKFEEVTELRDRERQLVKESQELEQRTLDDALGDIRNRLGLAEKASPTEVGSQSKTNKGGNMPIAMMVDNPEGSQEIYEKVREHLGLEDKPAGGIFHAAGPSPNGGWRVIEVWESQDDANRFLEERLKPAYEALDVPGRPEPQFWPVHNFMT